MLHFTVVDEKGCANFKKVLSILLGCSTTNALQSCEIHKSLKTSQCFQLYDPAFLANVRGVLKIKSLNLFSLYCTYIAPF